jgi:hypothetical protein
MNDDCYDACVECDAKDARIRELTELARSLNFQLGQATSLPKIYEQGYNETHIKLVKLQTAYALLEGHVEHLYEELHKSICYKVRSFIDRLRYRYGLHVW